MRKKKEIRKFYINENERILVGYHAIYDRDDEMETIWIDCKREYLPIIVQALNKYISKKFLKIV